MRRDRAGVLACITDELVDSIALIAHADQVRERLDEYFDAGIDEISVALLKQTILEASRSATLGAQVAL